MTTTSTTGSVSTPSTVERSSAYPAAAAAAVVGGLFAAVSCYWGLGGSWLLDTVGGGLESAARSGSGAVVVLVWATAAAKIVAVVVPLYAVRSRTSSGRGLARRVAWVEAVVLTGYGAVLTAVGLLVQFGVVPTGAGADRRALAWHAFLWDPWFLVWGLLVTVALTASRRAPTVRRPRRGTEVTGR